ncbi:DUF2339 domain-containing protein [Sphingomonas fuzhouensis]|uniref:DUF2339 domain-containing protein n=1 Tax=Sphingomonas fuzhouensis TaxID=3106033 RepID=UPI002AFE1690|nr:DUF2339 domain-containing protein [Sphingomonas sp. SGZ-02]
MMLMTIVLAVLLAMLWQEVRRLRARIAVLEAGASFAPVFEPDSDIADRPFAPAPVPAAPPPPPTVDWSPPIPFPASPPFVVEESVVEEVEFEPAAPVRGFGFEEIFGRRLPIWAGGLTLAVAGVLIVRYSIEAGLLSPLVRVVMGWLFGSALIAGAELALRRDEAVRDPRVRQALAGAGIATLYAVTLAAANLYGLIGSGTAFAVMTGVTILAGGLSLRFGAPSALLGLLGGLAAPALLGAGEPDVSLLTLYLALTVGGLCMLGRRQGWAWLGATALLGGFGWGTLLIVSGALGFAASLSLGLYALVLAIGLPMLLVGDRATLLRAGAGLMGCAQMAALVALGGFGALQWALFGLISVAVLWLSRRETLFADMPVAALGVALLLGCAWPNPSILGLTLLLCGVVAIHAAPAAWRVWRSDVRRIDAPIVAAAAAAIGVLPAIHGHGSGMATLVGAVLAAGVAAWGWRVAERGEDARFAVLANSAGLLTALAGAQALPLAAWASVAAVVGAALVLLGDTAEDRRIERIGMAFGLPMLALLGIDEGIQRLFGEPMSGHASHWILPALAAILIAWRSDRRRAWLVQPVAVVIGYGAVAQLLPGVALPWLAVALLGGLAATRRGALRPASAAAAALVIGWALMPVWSWIAASVEAMAGTFVPLDRWPDLADALSRLALPGLAIGAAAWWLPLDRQARRIGGILGLGLMMLAAHVALKHAIGIDTAAAFVMRAPMERTMWEAMLALGAGAAWRFGRRDAAIGLGAAALAHGVWFTGIVLNPLIVLQQSGPWLAIGYAVMGALLWAMPRALPDMVRARDGALMALSIVASFTLLRQLSHRPMPLWDGTGQGEKILRSLLALALAGLFLGLGIVRRKRDCRVASLALMLVAVVKVFLFDAAGLDGLARIASFAALGFSLIGIGWLYSRYLPDELAR